MGDFFSPSGSVGFLHICKVQIFAGAVPPKPLTNWRVLRMGAGCYLHLAQNFAHILSSKKIGLSIKLPFLLQKPGQNLESQILTFTEHSLCYVF